MSCAKNHDIERRRAVVKLPRAREKEREEDTLCSVVHIISSRDVISEIHTRETTVSYVTFVPNLLLVIKETFMYIWSLLFLDRSCPKAYCKGGVTRQNIKDPHWS